MFILESGKGQKSVMWKAPDISGMMPSSHLYFRYSIFLPFYFFTLLPFKTLSACRQFSAEASLPAPPEAHAYTR